MTEALKEMRMEELDQVAGGYDYTMTAVSSVKDGAGNIIEQTWKLFNRQSGKFEYYTASDVKSMLTKINESNKGRGEEVVRLFNGNTGEIVRQWRVD